MMQQSWRRQHGSSGELDVFGATRYFAGGLPDFPNNKLADRLIQEYSKVMRVMEDEQLAGLHDDDERRHVQQLGGVGKPSGKSKLAALLSFVVSPSPRASFRKESPPSPLATNKKLLLLAAGDEPAKISSSSSSSRESSVQQGRGGVHDELDLGVAVGDRRLQGVRVVRGRSGGEERWVVRCGAWDWDEEEEHLERMLDDAGSSDPKDEVVEEGDDGWESDSSSDLFDLDLEYIC